MPASRRVDTLQCSKLNARIRGLHAELQGYLPCVERIAVCLHDASTDEIATFLCSPGETPLRNYRVKLNEAPWLDQLRRTRRARVVNDLRTAYLGRKEHTVRLRQSGFRASYTVPIFDGDSFVGFVFFNSRQPGVFSPHVVHYLDLFVRLITLTIEGTLRTVTTLVGSIGVLREVAHFRDEETARHLTRMSQYSAIIAREMAGGLNRDDEWIEQVRLFAPLHDIGKIAVPDAVLLKPGDLSADEVRVMQQHTVHGAELLTTLVAKLGLEELPNMQALLDIARHHHERWDGSGYPDGLRGEGIPLEARIVKVADVFDALTTRRCYKAAWPIGETLDYLQAGCGVLFDRRCVGSLMQKLPAVREVMSRFGETAGAVFNAA